jgi:hypothetical protein
VRLIGETPERLGQSAKQSTTVCGQAGRGATVAGRHPPAVQESRKSGFSACQVLWKIVGRSASHAALCRASSFMCATQELEPNGKKIPVHRLFIHHGVPVAGGSLWSIYLPLKNGINKSHDLIIQYLSPHGIYAMVPCMHCHYVITAHACMCKTTHV